MHNQGEIVRQLKPHHEALHGAENGVARHGAEDHGAENGVARHGAEDEEVRHEVAIGKNRHKVGEDRQHKAEDEEGGRGKGDRDRGTAQFQGRLGAKKAVVAKAIEVVAKMIGRGSWHSTSSRTTERAKMVVTEKRCTNKVAEELTLKAMS